MSDRPEAFPGNAGPADYPRMLYHADGRTRIVDSASEHERCGSEWSQQPWKIHQRPVATPSIAAGAFDPLAIMLRDVLNSVLDERGIGRSKDEAVPQMPPLKAGGKNNG